MDCTYQSLSHSKWDCKYHVVFVPKYRSQAIYGEIRRQLGPVFHELAKQKECQSIEGHLIPDHVHMRIAILLKLRSRFGDWIHQRQERDSHCSNAGQRTELRRRTFLGAWIVTDFIDK